MLGVTVKSDTGVMILENSLSSKSHNKSKKPDFSKTTKTTASHIRKPPQDQLNNWDYCNPSNYEDPLPQPYRFIDRCLNELIMNKVYEQVFEIEKYKSDANYEGSVKEIISSGSFDIEGICYLAYPEGNFQNHLLAGDYYGNVYLLDLNKKVQITKFSVSPGKRVINISANTLKDDDNITTICVICRGEPIIHIFRYKSGENKVYKSFTINLLKKNELIDKNTQINQFPYACKISIESKFVAAAVYSGNIEIFILKEAQISTPLSNSIIPSDFKPTSSKNIPIKPSEIVKPQTPTTILDSPIIEIYEPSYSIPIKIPLKTKTYEDTLNNFIQKVEKKNIDEPLDTKQPSKDNKKVPSVDPKKAGGTANSQKLETNSVMVSDYESNEIQILGEIRRNDKDADISVDFRLPEYRADFFFLFEKLFLPNDVKTFSKVKEFLITTGIVLVWVKQKNIDFHKLQNLTKENLPLWIQQRIKGTNSTEEIRSTTSVSLKPEPQVNKPDPSKKHPAATTNTNNANIKPAEIKNEQQPLVEKKLMKSFDVLYNITVATINKSNTFLAIGLMDGSVFVYDILLFQEHCYLDKHVGEVTHLNFYEDWTIVSGSSDGVIHIYSLKTNQVEMKRTNIFKPKNLEIRGLEISETGMALVIDNQYNARVYDLIHFEKVMKLIPVSVMDELKKQWCLWPKSVMAAQKDQFCLIVNQLEKNADPSNLTSNDFKKNSKLLIYRIYDNLLNIFPALSNLSRKGIAKEQIFNAYQRMSIEDLKNPHFDIPNYASDNRSRTLTGIQTKPIISKHLPVIDENENPSKSIKFQTMPISKTKATATQDKKNQDIVNSSMTFSKIHTKESEMNSSIDLNSSFKTLPPASIIGIGKGIKNKKNEKPEGLTNEALHPENILNESKKMPAPELFHPIKDPIQQTLNFSKDKILRQEKMEKTFTKINTDLELQEVKNNLRKKKEMLKKI